MAVASKQLVSRRRTLAASRIARKVWRFQSRPCLLDGSDQSPLSFDLITARKKRCITSHHVQQERFVSGGQTDSKCPLVTEIHVHGGGLHVGAGTFRPEADDNAFVGLDAQYDHVRFNQILRRAWNSAAVRLKCTAISVSERASRFLSSRKTALGPAPILGSKLDRHVGLS